MSGHNRWSKIKGKKLASDARRSKGWDKQLKAVTLAERGCRLAEGRSHGCLDALAVAYAAAGRFSEAIAAAQKAMSLASAGGETLAARQIESRLRLYEEHRAYRGPVQPPVHHPP